MSRADKPDPGGEGAPPGARAEEIPPGKGFKEPFGSSGRPAGGAAAPPGDDRANPALVAGCVVLAAASWYLLKEFTLLLRPLLLAIFLCYAILPEHHRLTRHISPLASMAVLAGLSVSLLLLLAWLIAGSAVQLAQEMPALIQRAQEFLREARKLYVEHLPPWLAEEATALIHGEILSAGSLQEAATALASAAASTLKETILVGIYLVFLLLEAGRVPQRIQSGFREQRADTILAVIGNINAAMASYLRVKVRANLVLAIPVTVVLWAFGVQFALMWGVLTFLFNFIPYLGSILACGGPIVLAFLQMDSFGRAAGVAASLVAIHLLSANLVEPAMTGKAVGLSPVVVLVALSFWGLCWGVIGMLLAVPLTVMLKVVFENVPFTRPIARLMGDDG